MARPRKASLFRNGNLWWVSYWVGDEKIKEPTHTPNTKAAAGNASITRITNTSHPPLRRRRRTGTLGEPADWPSMGNERDFAKLIVLMFAILNLAEYGQIPGTSPLLANAQRWRGIPLSIRTGAEAIKASFLLRASPQRRRCCGAILVAHFCKGGRRGHSLCTLL